MSKTNVDLPENAYVVVEEDLTNPAISFKYPLAVFFSRQQATDYKNTLVRQHSLNKVHMICRVPLLVEGFKV